jgi:DNA-binding transcriptional ArsR family regulator
MSPPPRRPKPTMSRALTHPTRRRILAILSDRVASPREIAEEMGEPLGRLSHHVRWLADCGLIELERTEPRRGAVEHFYRSARRPVLDDEGWAALSPRKRRELAQSLLAELWVEAIDAVEHGAFDSRDVHLSRTVLELDEQGRTELAQQLQALVEAALRIRAESAERLAGREGGRSRLAMLLFESDGLPGYDSTGTSNH